MSERQLAPVVWLIEINGVLSSLHKDEKDAHKLVGKMKVISPLSEIRIHKTYCASVVDGRVRVVTMTFVDS